MSVPTPPPDGSVPPPQDPQFAPQAYPAAPGYAAPGYGVPVTPQRNMLMFVVSIILIVAGAFDIIGAFGVFGAVGLASAAGVGVGVSAGLLVILGILMLIVGVCSLVAGIMGVRNASNPAAADLLFKLGIVLCVLALISMILGIVAGSGVASGIFGFVLPVLFVIGANQMKQQARVA